MSNWQVYSMKIPVAEKGMRYAIQVQDITISNSELNSYSLNFLHSKHVSYFYKTRARLLWLCTESGPTP